MKKTRIVGLLLVFVLVTSCFVGGTFAKYASKATGSDTAVVAKWSIEVNNDEIATTNGDPKTISFELFGTAAGDTNNEDSDGNDDDVDDTNERGTIIAPGTTGFFAFTIEKIR